MRKLILLLMLLTVPAFADEDYDSQDLTRFSHFSINSGIHHFGAGLGGTLSVTSPYFANDSIAIRLGWLIFDEEFRVNDRFQRYDFHLMEASVLFSQYVGERLRGYWKLGFGIAVPDSSIASSVALSTSSALGLEYFPWRDSPLALFGQIGGIHVIRGRADKIEGEPSYGRGVQVVTGMSVYL